MKNGARAGIVVLIIAVASASSARADAVLTFTSPTLVITSGGTVEFDGTLTNTGADDIYLNSDTFSLLFPDLTFDDSPFIFEAPLSLSAGNSYTGPFIDVTADVTILPGTYSSTFTILGGADSNALNDIASEDFAVDVASASSTPEPSPLLLLVTGLAMIGVMRMRRGWHESK